MMFHRVPNKLLRLTAAWKRIFVVVSLHVYLNVDKAKWQQGFKQKHQDLVSYPKRFFMVSTQKFTQFTRSFKVLEDFEIKCG